MGVYDTMTQVFKGISGPETGKDGGWSVEDYKPLDGNQTAGSALAPVAIVSASNEAPTQIVDGHTGDMKMPEDEDNLDMNVGGQI